MADHPILFSAPMIRALLREIEKTGTGKTQTRGIIKPQPWNRDGDAVDITIAKSAAYINGSDGRMYFQFEHPLGGPLTAYVAKINVGDRLWCREAWHAARSLDRTPTRDIPRDADIEYAATARSYAEVGLKGKLRPAMFMPLWMSRLTLYVTEVRVEWLQDISEADARAEGVECDSDGWCDYLMPQTQCCATAKGSFASLWDSINGPGAWDANPWVSVMSFRPVLGNIGSLPTTSEVAA